MSHTVVSGSMIKEAVTYMKAGEILISGIFNGSRLLEVPFYQRAYVWQEEQWERLLEDLKYVTSIRKQYFMGSIILKNGRTLNTWEKYSECKVIIDGQQRMTTLLIFMKVLCLKKNENRLFERDYILEDESIALRHGQSDIEAFKKVVGADTDEPIDNSESKSQIIEAFNYFCKNIEESLYDRTIIRQNVQFVCIDLTEDEDEQQVFDTINSLGVRLTTAELLKNYFFNQNNVLEYRQKWAGVFEKDDDAKAYWDTEIETGRIRRSMIDIFFDSYFQIFVQDSNYGVATEDKLMYARVDRLAKSYQHFINTYCDGDKNVILSSLKDYADCFREIFDPTCCERSVPATYGIERLNVVIFGLKNTTMIPYVLYLAKNAASQNEFNQLCGVLESYTMRRMAVHATTKNYNNLYTSLILNQISDADSLSKRLSAGNDSTTYVPTDTDLENGFLHSKLYNLQTKGILYLIESGIRPANSATALLGFNGYSLEHLMPKKWRNNWPACANDELARERDSKLLTLGNLAIITQSLNASIRDSDWATKKAGKKNKPGLDMCAAGLNTLSDALGKSDWNETEIEARAEQLYNKAAALWKV